MTRDTASQRDSGTRATGPLLPENGPDATHHMPHVPGLGQGMFFGWSVLPRVGRPSARARAAC
ncbi:MAG TPA: hypothetical protein VGN32_12270, partial [Ktedonobacterales bacterium]|nr:hypothetical protein [Ktedonobacterales bacterium]